MNNIQNYNLFQPLSLNLNWAKLFRLARILILKYERIIETISDERRIYESVDDRRLS